jgi:hypothetical protein
VIVPPASGRAAVDRSAHLRGARGQRHGLIALNLEGRIAPAEAAVLREGLPDPLRFSHQVFIDHLAQALPEHVTPVIDKAFVGGVVARKVFKIVVFIDCIDGKLAL